MNGVNTITKASSFITTEVPGCAMHSGTKAAEQSDEADRSAPSKPQRLACATNWATLTALLQSALHNRGTFTWQRE